VGQLAHTLPEGRPVCGVTLLAGEIYLLRPKGGRDQVEVYNVVTYRFQRYLSVPNARGFIDMTSCEHNRCMYISDHSGECIHRLDVQGAVTRWTVNDKPWGISVNAARNVIVTCDVGGNIKEFNSHGVFVRELPHDVIKPCHAIQTRSGRFIVCHGGRGDPVNSVCMLSDDGRHIVYPHRRQPGSDTGQYDEPYHLAVDDNEFVFVVDVINRRVTLLSPTLKYVRHVVSRDQLKWRPSRLYLDRQRRQLYVTDNEWNDEHNTSTVGRVVVFSV